jgi:hypothetical protein
MTFELSPSLVTPAADAAEADAYEIKFHLAADLAARVEAWARQRLSADPHGDDGRYLITTLYCDTAAVDIFHRSQGFKRSKYRLRRYGDSALVYLERKRRWGDKVCKRRDSVPVEELVFFNGPDVSLDWAGLWFYRQLRFRELRPSCRVAYARTAFMGSSPTGPIRLTLDRDVRGVPAEGWDVAPVEGGKALLNGGVILELKFRTVVPQVFLELLADLPPTGEGLSKYRLCVQTWGLAGGSSWSSPNG